MKFRRLCFFLALLMLSAFADRATAQDRDHDVQFWHETQLLFPFVKSADKKRDKLSLVLIGTFRASRNNGGALDERVGVGIEFRPNSFLTITPSIVYRADQNTAGRTSFETRFRLDGQVEHKFTRATLKNRARIEHRMRNSNGDVTRFRNKFQVLIPVVGKDKNELFAPYVATEPFYEFQAGSWSRNELSFGIVKKFGKNVSADFFYMIQNNRNSSLRYSNNFGVNLKFRID